MARYGSDKLRRMSRELRTLMVDRGMRADDSDTAELRSASGKSSADGSRSKKKKRPVDAVRKESSAANARAAVRRKGKKRIEAAEIDGPKLTKRASPSFGPAVKGTKSTKGTLRAKGTAAAQTLLKAEQKVRLGNGRRVEIGGLRDEHGVYYIWVRVGWRVVVVPYAEWHGGGGAASATLRDQGLVVPGGIGDIRKAVDLVKRFPRVPIVTKPGWSRYGFVLADGRVLVAKGRPEPLKAFTTAGGILGQGGSMESWKELVAAPLADHQLAAFFVMMMFAGALLRLTNRADNFGFELSGEAGRGKSTLQILIASAAGPAIGNGDATYWRTLNSTTNALETVMPLYNDVVLILDEGGLVQGAGKAEARGLTMRDIAFRLATGVVKHRFGIPEGPLNRMVFMLSTNRSIGSLLGSAHAAESDAIADRLMTIPLLPDREHGIFDHCPPSYDTTGAFADALKQAASQHFGHALPKFLRYLMRRVDRDTDLLQTRIQTEVDRFVQRCGANTNDGSQKRVAEAFGLVYAAGWLAKRADVLPDSYDCMKAARAAYDLHRTHGRALLSFDDRLRALLKHPSTTDLAQTGMLTLTEKQRIKCPVYLYTERSGGREIVIPMIHMPAVFPDWKGIHDDPDIARRLKRVKGRQTRRRPIGKSGKKEPAYVFDVTDLEG